MSDTFGIYLFIGAFLISFVGFYAWALDHERKECEARGGHVVRKYLYKSTLRLCIDNNGRILE